MSKIYIEQADICTLSVDMIVCPGLTYEDMPVGNGGNAMSAFMLLYFDKLPKEEAKKLRQDLLAYCWQDTFAMVKLVDFLYIFKN